MWVPALTLGGNRMRIILTTACIIVTCHAAAAQPLTSESLSRMSRSELEAIYRGAATSSMPSGFVRGRVLHMNGPMANVRERTGNAAWRGKTFDPAGGAMVNKWLFGFDAVKARVEPGTSWLDGEPSLIADYRGVTKVIWRDMRDEIREVAPGLWLGIAFHGDHRRPGYAALFALESK